MNRPLTFNKAITSIARYGALRIEFTSGGYAFQATCLHKNGSTMSVANRSLIKAINALERELTKGAA